MTVSKPKNSKFYHMDFYIFGQRVHKSTGKLTEKEAKKVELLEKTRIEKAIIDGTWEQEAREKNAVTLSKAIERIYRERWTDNADGERQKRMALRLVELLGDKKLTDYSSDDVAKLRMALKDTGVTEARVNRYLTVMRTIFITARDTWEVIGKIPKFTLTEEPERRFRVITQEERQAVLELLVQYGELAMKDFLIVFSLTGIRPKHLLRLESRDISLDKKIITIWKNKGKKAKAYTVPMVPEVVEVLFKRKDKTILFDDCDYYHMEKVFRKVRKALKKDDDFILYAFRHTFATTMAEKGVEGAIIQELMGHSDYSTTERYIHFSQQKKMSILNDVFSQ